MAVKAQTAISITVLAFSTAVLPPIDKLLPNIPPVHCQTTPEHNHNCTVT